MIRVKLIEVKVMGAQPRLWHSNINHTRPLEGEELNIVLQNIESGYDN